ncbi:MAG: chemotaxis response regulator protein-glutamate methylesterase [Spirochaetaceae bacterium]|nr:chemotaxis response regulator protein-glutamate methylesterase [Spirochaetaceae bacterium]
MEPINVLVVDDSALMRNLIGKIVESDPAFKVAGKAMNGRFALEKIPLLKPDIMTLDLEMPEMDGITFLKERKRLGITVPVIILSSLATKSAAITMEALALGASDFIMKPSGSISEDLHTISHSLLEMLRSYAARHRAGAGYGGAVSSAALPKAPAHTTAAHVPIFPSLEKKTTEPARPLQIKNPIDIVAIGISTGGPNALREVFAALPADYQVPTVVVQHMPAGFTAEFAKSLDRICPQEVKEAEEGDIVKAGRILIAPGGARHMIVEKKPLAIVTHLVEEDLVNGHRPSADVLFESVAKNFGSRSLALIMTGMGKDGAQQIGAVYNAGGVTLGQDEASSIVYGMPRVAFENGFVQKQVALPDIAPTIYRLTKEANG